MSKIIEPVQSIQVYLKKKEFVPKIANSFLLEMTFSEGAQYTGKPTGNHEVISLGEMAGKSTKSVYSSLTL